MEVVLRLRGRGLRPSASPFGANERQHYVLATHVTNRYDIPGVSRVIPRIVAPMSLLDRVRGELGLQGDVPLPEREVPLPAHTDVAGLSWAAVAAASLAAARFAGVDAIPLDVDRVAVAYASERYLRVDGAAPDVWAPLSGFWRTADGWVRTHGNYPHHAAALRRALGLSAEATREEMADALRDLPTDAAIRAVTAAGGLCVAVRPEVPAADAELRTGPLVRITRIGDAPAMPQREVAPDAPLRGIRVLDLTRVIAGPVATRTLALLGADVLRIDPPGLPEIALQHLDTGHGKRSALLDVRADRTTFHALLEDAHVVVLGYRPAALDRLGLSPRALASRHPGLVVARLAAWTDPDRRGFDSLVQAESGIAWIESADGGTPGALPAQALDHSAGYLLAAGVSALLARRRHEGGSWLVETSLRRIAAELLGMPRTAEPTPAAVTVDPGPHLQTFEIDGAEITTAGPAIAYAGAPQRFTPPRTWGVDPLQWA